MGIEFRYCNGDLLESQAYALVNTVNCVGVMGKGIAKAFREHYPQMYEHYRKVCQNHQLKVGKLLTFQETDVINNSWHLVVCLPTKKHWRNPSKMEWVKAGVDALINLLNEDTTITSIAIPPLGAGCGGLDKAEVLRLITASFSINCTRDDLTVYLYQF